MYNELESKL